MCKDLNIALIAIISLGLIAMSCDQSLNGVPTQIKIDEYEVNTYQDQGTAAQQFTDLYVYENEIFSGAFPLPATIPTLTEGDIDIVLYPGIRENGMDQGRIIYPFMEIFRTQIAPSPYGTVFIKPIFNYKSDVKFKLIDEFESETQFSEDLDQDPETMIEFVSGYEGNSGHVILSKDHPEWEVANHSAKSRFPYDGTAIYLEMHYKSDVEIQVGLIGWSQNIDKTKHFKIALRPSSDWNKIYINFTPEIQNSELEFYQIVLRANHSGQSAEEDVYLDNIKWLHL